MTEINDKKRKLQILTDLTMTVLLPLLMTYELIGSDIHEWFGMGMFVLFILHHTNITNLGAVKIVLGMKRFLLYIVYIMMFSLMTGLLINFFI